MSCRLHIRRGRGVLAVCCVWIQSDVEAYCQADPAERAIGFTQERSDAVASGSRRSEMWLAVLWFRKAGRCGQLCQLVLLAVRCDFSGI